LGYIERFLSRINIEMGGCKRRDNYLILPYNPMHDEEKKTFIYYPY